MKKLSLFIIGMPRSGTKLFRELLNNHNKIFIPTAETVFIPKLLKKFKNKKLTKNQVEQAVEEIQNSLFYFFYSQEATINFKTLLNSEYNNITELINTFFLEMAKQRRSKAEILGDKSPNYINDLELLLSHFPEAKFIHIIRDPRDYVLSVKKAWGKNMYRAAYRWRSGIENISEVDDKFRNRILEVRYEDLLDDPESVLNKTCEFLGIEYQNDMHILNRNVENYGDAKGKTQILATNKSKYKDKLTNRQIKRIESLTYPTIADYYELESEIDEIYTPTKVRLSVWKLFDGLSLLNFAVKKHGFLKALDVIKKARKAKS